MTHIEDMVTINGKYALMFHYVKDYDTAHAIIRSKNLNPSDESDMITMGAVDSRYLAPRANVTTIKPEKGIERVAAETGLNNDDVRYCVEMLVDREKLSRSLDHLPNAYQIFSNEPIDIIPNRITDMYKLGRGVKMLRWISPNNGLPYAQYERPQLSF